MINSRKKGFTFVELVIVIAVVAVLAAVLIPNFGNSVKKANMSDDQQAVVQMNKLLALDEVADPKPETTDAVVAVLIKNGYSDDLTTYYSDYKLAWLKEHNDIVLVENDTVEYPEKYAEESFESIQNGETVFVSEDVITDGLSADIAGEYTVNLNGNKLESEGCVVSWTEGAKLVISNGTIDSNVEGTAVLAKNAGSVEITNVQVYAPSGVNPLQCYDGTFTINPDSITTGQVRINGTVVDNGNGTWTV